MGSGLLLVVIPALLVFGVVVLMTAIIYGTSDKPRADRERRRQHERWKRRGQELSSPGPAVRDRPGARQGTPLITMTNRWWLEVRHHALDARVRWLKLESTTGQVIAVAAVSVLAACLLFATMG